MRRFSVIAPVKTVVATEDGAVVSVKDLKITRDDPEKVLQATYQVPLVPGPVACPGLACPASQRTDQC